MSHDEQNGGDDFERAMRDVERLPDDRRAPVRKRRQARRREIAREPSYAFDVERFGEQVEGLVRGGEARWLAELRRDEVAPEAELDLHRKRRDEARYAVHRFLAASHRDGCRCVLIIHGRGLHTDAERGQSVLKRGVADWVVEPEVAAKVVAFCTAPPHLGGGGALLVMLRRQRRENGRRRGRR